MLVRALEYITHNPREFWLAVKVHLTLSTTALLVAKSSSKNIA